MRLMSLWLAGLVLVWPIVASADEAWPPGFVAARDVVPGLVEEIRYFGEDNFVGEPIDGYEAPVCILTVPAAEALAGVQERLKPFGLGIKVFDCYRPQQAVDHFVRWAADPDATEMQERYYPNVPKDELFERGYIAEQSTHSRGSTVDVTLVDRETGSELDMGTDFDRFSPRSWPDAADATPQQRANRVLLQRLMVEAGFEPYAQEWWHFTLANEPFPETSFDFPVAHPPRD
ncbi:D-Ala-D-Ala dipeptidase [Thioalkalivibrio sp. K90mix]|uniref:M15 family metallopeptidase n=1 Tax=Thioalkalivibrio sp. (strain K90mix) TaxID=396595 RepID=UPI000195A783|nr:M15 family metallopeptidase [Thioalkalivibrio sp. K90mix]ADC70594.1 D-Ala-D-Ala dipeptidase [Thioalkalivibrio sp. K90mix]